MDEMFSYGLANSNYQPFVEKGEDANAYGIDEFMSEYGAGNNAIELLGNLAKDLKILSSKSFRFKETPIYEAYRIAQTNNNAVQKTSWLSGDYFKRYLTVTKGEGFNYASVYYNQRADVHPPLYYMLLHTICSFTPEKFSKWQAFVVNLVAFWIALILLFHIAEKNFGGADTALLVSCIFGVSSVGLSGLTFFRMYMWLTVWTLAYVDLHLFFKRCNWKLTKGRKAGLVALTVLGYLTHYYFVLFAGFTMLTVIGLMIMDGKQKQIVEYVRQFIWSAMIGLAVWPFSVKHVFRDYRGQEAWEAFGNAKGIWNGIKWAISCVRDKVFVKSAVFLWIFVALAVVGFVLSFVVERDAEVHADRKKMFLSFLPAGLYIVTVGAIAPLRSPRYFMNVLPLFMLMVVVVMKYLLRILTSCRKWIRRIVVAILGTAYGIWISCFVIPVETLEYSEQESFVVKEDTACVYVVPDGYYAIYTSDAVWLSKCSRVALIGESEVSFLETAPWDAQANQGVGENVIVVLSPYLTDMDQTLEEVKTAMKLENVKEFEASLDSNYMRRYRFSNQ